MKRFNSITKLILLIFFSILFIPKGYSQFYPAPFTTDQQGCTDNSQKIDAIGIGDFFLYGDVPKAGLDIHMPYLFDAGNQVGQGQAFSSYVEPDYQHFWSMYTYPSTLKGYISNPATGVYQDNFIMSSVLGHVDFRAKDIHYMRLHSNGRLGIADAFGPLGTGFAAQSLLHLNQSRDDANVWEQFTNGNTGYSTANMGLSIGIEPNSGYPGSAKSFAKFVQHSDAPMKFYTKDIDRLIINATYNPTIHSSTVNTTGFVGIGENFYWNEETAGEGPRSLLHLQGPNNTTYNGRGWRTWNKTGIYISEHSDQMYVGLKNEFTINGANRSDAIISWGDDRLTSGDQHADNFRIIFTGVANGAGNGGTNPRDPATFSGLETMRMTPFGMMGVGPLFTWNTPPARRLELLDLQNPSTTSSVNEPQLRLSYTQAAPGSITSTGKWTDFQSTSNGDLFVNPKDGTTDRRVGINITSPISTLHVGGTTGITNGEITTDYLNHSYHPSPSAPGSNPWMVYSDANGTLQNLPQAASITDVLHGNGTWGAGGNGNVIACSTAVTNYIPVFTSSTGICNSQIYDDGAKVGIGFGASLPSTSTYRLALNGNLRLDNHSDALFLGADRFLCSEGNSYTSNMYLGINAGPAGLNTCSGVGDICIGGGAGASLSNAENHNILIGQDAGNSLSGTGTQAEGNICMGFTAGASLTTGRANVCIGGTSGGTGFTSQNQNVMIGYQAGLAGGGTDNTFVGFNTGLTGTFNGSTAIGSNASVQASNSVALGQWAICGSPDAISLGDCGSGTTQVRTLMGYTTVPTVGPPSTGFRLYCTAIANTNSAFFSGRVFENSAYVTSDSTLKRNIQNISPTFAKDVINSLHAKSYDFDINNNPSMNLESGIQYGLLAQDVESVLPGLVTEVTAPATLDPQGNITSPEKTFKALNYTGLIPLLLEYVNNQELIIDSLKSRDSLTNIRVDALEQLIINCCNSGQVHRTANPTINIDLSNSIILSQNDPNPFAEETKISFTIPASVQNAKIIFTDNLGHIIQTVLIGERGDGQLNVYASNLTSGIYSYSLIADGKVIDSKKMVLTK